MNAVGIDVSKGKSTVTIRRPGGIVLMPPRDIPHTQSSINELIEIIRSLDGETKVCMEHTGRYYEPVATWLSDAGIFVSAVNPVLIKDFRGVVAYLCFGGIASGKISYKKFIKDLLR